MRTDFAAGLNTELEKVTTDPVFLVELGFDTPVYFSTREQITYLAHTWIAADITVRLGDKPVLSIFNESFSIGATVLSQGTTGRYVKIYSYYNTHGTLLFSGELGDAVVGERVDITCKPRPPNKTPRFYAIPPHCNFIPKAGTRITTAAGNVITLESR